MKKTRGLILAAMFSGAVLSGAVSAGCAGQKNGTFSPAENCVYIARDGSVSSALVEEYEGETVDEKDLRQYLSAAVIRYNKENGGEESAENKPGAGTKLPAALSGLSVKDGVMKAVFDYASAEDMVKFRQTNDNADDSSTVTSVEVKNVADAAAAGWFKDAVFVKPDGAKAAEEELTKDAAGTAAAMEGGGTVRFSGKVLYMTEGVEKKDEYTVAVPEDKRSVVVFK